MERIIFEREPGSDTYELRVGALPAAAGVLSIPSPREVAQAIAASSGEWLKEFLDHLNRVAPERALKTGSIVLRQRDMSDPEFGVDAEDSERLLQLRSAIDRHLGWSSHTDEEGADYLARVREVGDALRIIENLRATVSVR